MRRDRSVCRARCVVPISRQLHGISISDHQKYASVLAVVGKSRQGTVGHHTASPHKISSESHCLSFAQAFLSLPCHDMHSFFAKIQYDTSQTYICCLTPPALYSFPVSLFHQICSCRRPCPVNQHPLLPNRTLPLHYADDLVCKSLSELTPSTTSRLLLVGCV